MKWLALDIGGANLKAADIGQFAVVQPFPLWQKPRQLVESLRALIAVGHGADHLAVTMTGELADCFVTKADGVRAIVEAVSHAADGRHTRIYLTDGRLVTSQVALTNPVLAAASNWHALARFAGRYAKHAQALLVDIGTTTTDIIPLSEGEPQTTARTDPERMANGQLLYTGVERTPLCALLANTSWRGQAVPVAHEVFSTMWDVYLTLGQLPEMPTSTHTADHRPASRACALDRLARSICADRTMFSAEDAMAMASAAADAQASLIQKALEKVIAQMSGAPQKVIICGRGEFLARSVLEKLKLDCEIVSLNQKLGPELSECATAHALAVLATEAMSES